MLVSFYYLWKGTDQAQTYRNERTKNGQKKIKLVSFNSQEKMTSNAVCSTFPIRCDHCKSKNFTFFYHFFLTFFNDFVETFVAQISHVHEITPKKLCAFCFTHWKKYYSFPHESQIVQAKQNSMNQSNKTSTNSSNKSQASLNGISKEHIYYRAVNLMKDARFIVRDIMNYKRIAKNPFQAIDQTLFSDERKCFFLYFFVLLYFNSIFCFF